MGTLRDCLEKVYGAVFTPEARAVAKKAMELRKDGYTGREADAEAVKYFLNKLADERQSVMRQVEEAPRQTGEDKQPAGRPLHGKEPDTEAMPFGAGQQQPPTGGGPVGQAAPTQVAQQTRPIPRGLRRSDTLKHVEETLGVPLRVGKFRGPFAGIYKKTPQVVRLKKANDIGTAAHEVAHHIQNMIGLGGRMPAEIQAMSYTKNPRKIDREGFAEFVRYWIVDEAKVRSEAPAFVQQFEQALEQHPDVSDALTRIKESWNAWQAAAPVQKIASIIRRGGDEGKRRYTLNDAYSEWVDSLRPVELLSNAISERKGSALEPVKDPYMLAWLTRGWARKAEQMLKYGTFQLDENQGVVFTGKSLREILKPIEQAGKTEQLDVYLLAKRAVNDPRILKGFEGVLSEQELMQAVETLEGEYGQVAKELYEYQDELLKYLVQSQRISEDMADAYRDSNAFYAPLYRVMDDTPPTESRRGAGRFSEIGNPAKRLKGSSRDVFSPVENIIKNTFAFVNAAERNRVGVAILEATGVKGMGDMIERIPFPLEPRKIDKSDFINLLNKYGNVEHIRNVNESRSEIERVLAPLRSSRPVAARISDVAKEALERRGFSAAEAQQIVDRISASGTTAEKQEIIEKTIEKTTVITIKDQLGFGGMPDEMIHSFRPAYRAGTNEAIFYENGKPVLVEMSPELAKAIKGVDPEGPNILMKLLALPAKTLRAGATLTPEFAARNPVRDQMTAWIFSKYGYVPGWDLIKGIYHTLKVDDIYQKYNASGAAHAALVSLDRDYLSKKLEDITKMQTPGESVRHPLKTAGRFVTASIKNPLKVMQMISELTEEATRVGGFARALKAEGGDLNALMRSSKEARDMTLDFARSGAKGKAVNMVVAFWNAQVQGVDKMRRSFKERPGATTIKALVGITLPSVLLWLAQNDDPYYDEIPTWRRILFWNIITHNDDGTLKNIWSIPKPFEIGILFGSLPEMTLDWIKKNNPARFKKTVVALLEALSPGFVPTAAIPWVENFANRSLFFDRQISPRGSEDLSPYLQSSERTSETMKAIAKGFNHIPVLREYANPAKIENLLRGYTGGMGGYAVAATDKLLQTLGVAKDVPAPAMRMAELPLVRAFSQRWPTANAQSIEDFYEQYAENKRKWADTGEIGGWRGSGIQMKPAEKIMAGMPPELLAQDKVANALTGFRKQARAVAKSESLTPDQKREALDSIYLTMTDLARVALGRKALSTEINGKLTEGAK